MDRVPLSQIVLLTLILVGTANFALTTVELAPYDYDLDYSEGFTVTHVERFMDTGELYPELGIENGWEATEYTPLMYLLYGLLGSIFGYTFLVGRALSFLPLIGIAAITLLLLRQKGNINSRLYAIPFMIFIPFLSLYTAVTVRPGILGVFFSVAGIYMFQRDRKKISLALLLAAFFTKQIYVAAFGAIILALMAKKDWKTDLHDFLDRSLAFREFTERYYDIIRFGGIYVSGILIGVVVLQLWSEGQFFVNAVIANVGGWEIRMDLIRWGAVTFLPVFGLAAYHLYSNRDWLWGSYFVLSLVIGIIQFTRSGSWIHALIEPFVAATICAVLLYTRTEKPRITLNILLIVQIVVFLLAPAHMNTVFAVKDIPQKNQQADIALKSAAAAPGPEFSELAGYEISQGLNSSPEIYAMYEHYSAGRITDKEVRQFFREKNYSQILAYKRLEFLPIDRWIDENYRLKDEVTRFYLEGNKQYWKIYVRKGDG